MTSKKRAMALSAIAMDCLGALGAQSALADQSFVLQAAGKWSDAQTKAVQAAGGTVTFSHGETGIGVLGKSKRESQNQQILYRNY